MNTTKLFKRSSDNDLIYTEIFCAGIKYAEFAYGEADQKTEKIKEILIEIMNKAVKFSLEKEKLFKAMDETENLLLKESKLGTKAVGTHEVAGQIENFLTQGKGLLDVFSKQFLKELFGFNKIWNHNEIIKFLNNKADLDEETIKEIKRMLNDDWELWLEDLLDDRNLHHEKNFGLTEMILTANGPVMIMTRSNSAQITRVQDYIEISYNNILGLVNDLIYLSFCAIYPGLSSLRLRKEYFFPE